MTDDQKAMLRLLAQREEGYDDMAALMGISVEEVRQRVKEALTEVDEPETAAEEIPEPPPTPAPPAPQPPAASEPKAEEPPKPLAPAEPVPPAPETPKPAAKAPGAGAGKRPPKFSALHLPKDRGALIGLGAGALAVIVFAIVLIVAGGGGGSNSSSATTTTAESPQGETASAAAENESLTQAILTPTNGGASSGKALFGRYKKSVLLQVQAEGLDPSSKGQAYTIWLYRSPKIALQIGAVPVPASGKIAAQLQIPAQLLAYVANGAFNQVDIALTDTATYKAALDKAKAEKKLPPFTGESVLRGEITGPAIKSSESH
jgi:hypothetical protein